MYFFTWWTLQYVLLVFVADLSMTEDKEDLSKVERALLHYHEFKKADLLQWKWSRRAFCRAVRPGGIRITSVIVEKQEVMLESMNCTKIEVELLFCAGDAKDSSAPYFGWSSKFLSGPYGEIYVVHSPFKKTKCNDLETYTIQWAVVRGASGSGQSLRLWGVDEIFDEISLEGFNVLFQAGRKRHD